MRWPWSHSEKRSPSVTTKSVTLGLYLEALFVAGVGENEAFDPVDEEVSTETCRRLCALLYEDFPAEATPDALRDYAAAGWAALAATKEEAFRWAKEEQNLLGHLWGMPGDGQALPLTDYLLSLAGDAGPIAYCTMLDRPLWQAALWLLCSGVVSKGHETNHKLKSNLGLN